MTQIVGFAGKKQSGKNTACNFVLAMKLAELGICKKSRLSEDGNVEVTDILGETTDNMEWIPFESPYVDTKKLFENELGSFIKMYALADSLKEVAVSVLGLERKQAFGTDEDKNSKTNLKWQDMPGVINKSKASSLGLTSGQMEKLNLLVHKNGIMTAREVLQYVGTDIFRKMNSNVWIDSLYRKIEEDSPEVALISDVRFENEISSLQEKGGFVVGLSRDPYDKGDRHASEAEIENCINLSDKVIDNTSLSIPEQNEQIYYALEHLPNVMPVLTKD
tara:strand:+ start:12867 stop:13697 length:831 start_codon:yes stop_codon:yes gene_type:complete